MYRNAWVAVALVAALTGAPSPVAGQASRAAAPFDVYEASISELADALTMKRVTSVQLVDAYTARIHAYDHAGPALNAVIRLNPNARAEAAALDAELRERGPRSPLHGIPVLVKDNYEVAGLGASAGSLALAGWIPPTDARIVERLKAAGAVILGQTNMHELAHGITTIASIGGQTRNPYDPERNPGGSSGGTGAAIAASFAAIGWGTDTCGSIRIPAAHQNLFGLRPTTGMFSIQGIVPLSHTQDTPGPLARSAMDLAIALDATSGAESMIRGTPESSARAPAFQKFIDDSEPFRRIRIGVLTNWFGSGDEAEAARIVRTALDTIAGHGAELVEVNIPNLDSLLAGTSAINWELKWDLLDFLKTRPNAPVHSLHDMLEKGLYAQAMEGAFRARDTVSTRDSEPYKAVLAKQARVREVLDIVFAANDLTVIAYPTVRRKAALIGEGQQGSSCQLSASSGFPAVTMPAGFTRDGLPIGLEMMGRPRTDEKLVQLAYGWERLASPRRAPSRTPPLVDGHAPAPVSFVARATGEGGRAEVRFAYDATQSSLTYAAIVTGVRPTDVHALTLDLVADGKKGPVVFTLVGPGEAQRSGTIALPKEQREALLYGRLSLNLYTREMPAGAANGKVLPPRPNSEL